MTAAMGRVAVVHLGANSLLLLLAYYWLGLAESRAATLAWSVLVALVFLGLLCWTYGSALACLEANPWRTALRNLLPIAVAAMAVVVLYLLLARLDNWVRARGPLRRVLQAVAWLLWWVIVPVFAVPLLSRVANLGWRGFRLSWPGRLQWVTTPLLLLAGLWLPRKLLAWVPRFGGFGMEAVSFAIRATIAYLLFAASLLLLAFLTSGGRPRRTQPSTAVSP